MRRGEIELQPGHGENRDVPRLRRSLDPISSEPTDVKPATGIAPLLARLIDQQAATGLPPAYLPKDDGEDP